MPQFPCLASYTEPKTKGVDRAKALSNKTVKTTSQSYSQAVLTQCYYYNFHLTKATEKTQQRATTLSRV